MTKPRQPRLMLVARSPEETRRRRAWGRRIIRAGIQIFALSAYDERLQFPEPGEPAGVGARAVMKRALRRISVVSADEQQARRAFIALLWRHRIIRQWVVTVDDLEPMQMQDPSGAPLFIEGERWEDFAAELAALERDTPEGGHTPCDT